MRKFLLTTIALMFSVISLNAQMSDLKFHGEINGGMAIGKLSFGQLKSNDNYLTPNVTGVYGIRMGENMFLGAGTGLRYMFETGSGDEYILTLPLFAELKAAYPVNEQVSPFLMVDMGYSVLLATNINNDYLHGGFLLKVGAGIYYGNLSFALGYEKQKYNLKSNNISVVLDYDAFYFSVGYVFKK